MTPRHFLRLTDLSAAELGALIDSALEARLGPEWPDLPRAAALSDRFATATRLEAGFWDMALRPDPRA